MTTVVNSNQKYQATGSNVWIENFISNDGVTFIGIVHSCGTTGSRMFNSGDRVIYNKDNITAFNISCYKNTLHSILYYQILGKEIVDLMSFKGVEI